MESIYGLFLATIRWPINFQEQNSRLTEIGDRKNLNDPHAFL